MFKKFFLVCLFSAIACSSNKETMKSPTTHNNSYVIAKIDAKKMNPKKSAIKIGIYKKLLKQGSEVKDAMGQGGFVAPINQIFDYFIDRDAEFRCKDIKEVLYCNVFGKDTGDELMQFSLSGKQHDVKDLYSGKAEGDYVMHFCDVKIGFVVSEDNDEFWSHVTGLESSSKAEIYSQVPFAHFQGAVIVLKGDGDNTKIVDFRASFSKVPEGSEEYKKFVDPKCLHYKKKLKDSL